ncbi:hypothetical protein Dimus_002993 [Dionaea muscipula]
MSKQIDRISKASSSSSARQQELRKDKINNRWVIFSPARAKRPSDLKSQYPTTTNQSQECPFCVGHEDECAPEIFRVPVESKSDWKIRVIQNLYPALSRDIEPDPDGQDPDGSGVIKGFGFHDVVIESPTHPVHLPDLSASEVGDVLLAYRKRILQLAAVGSIKYVQVFKNYGSSAGASMSHSHSQIIALPIIPSNASARLEAMREYFHQSKKCILCEVPSKELLIDESTHFVSIAPFAATYAFEIWIIPRDHSSHFHHIDNEKAIDLGDLLKLLLTKMSLQLNNPPYNMMIHTSPLEMTEPELTCSHWFIQIVPHLTVLGGFEVGTGCYINSVFPEDAAQVLREVNIDI